MIKSRAGNAGVFTGALSVARHGGGEISFAEMPATSIATNVAVTHSCFVMAPSSSRKTIDYLSVLTKRCDRH
jgi:hypothetical protein